MLLDQDAGSSGVLWITSSTHIMHVDLGTSALVTAVELGSTTLRGTLILADDLPGQTERGVLVKAEHDVYFCGAVTKSCQVILTADGTDLSEGSAIGLFPPSADGASSFFFSLDWTFGDFVVAEIDADYTDNDDLRQNLKGLTPPAGCDAFGSTLTNGQLIYDPPSDSMLGFESNAPAPFRRFSRATDETDWATMCMSTIATAGTAADGDIGTTGFFQAGDPAGPAWDPVDLVYIVGSAHGAIRTFCPPLPIS
jgi:hypothetical protein